MYKYKNQAESAENESITSSYTERVNNEIRWTTLQILLTNPFAAGMYHLELNDSRLNIKNRHSSEDKKFRGGIDFRLVSSLICGYVGISKKKHFPVARFTPSKILADKKKWEVNWKRGEYDGTRIEREKIPNLLVKTAKREGHLLMLSGKAVWSDFHRTNMVVLVDNGEHYKFPRNGGSEQQVRQQAFQQQVEKTFHNNKAMQNFIFGSLTQSGVTWIGIESDFRYFCTLCGTGEENVSNRNLRLATESFVIKKVNDKKIKLTILTGCYGYSFITKHGDPQAVFYERKNCNAKSITYETVFFVESLHPKCVSVKLSRLDVVFHNRLILKHLLFLENKYLPEISSNLDQVNDLLSEDKHKILQYKIGNKSIKDMIIYPEEDQWHVINIPLQHIDHKDFVELLSYFKDFSCLNKIKININFVENNVDIVMTHTQKRWKISNASIICFPRKLTPDEKNKLNNLIEAENENKQTIEVLKELVYYCCNRVSNSSLTWKSLLVKNNIELISITDSRMDDPFEISAYKVKCVDPSNELISSVLKLCESFIINLISQASQLSQEARSILGEKLEGLLSKLAKMNIITQHSVIGDYIFKLRYCCKEMSYLTSFYQRRSGVIRDHVQFGLNNICNEYHSRYYFYYKYRHKEFDELLDSSKHLILEYKIDAYKVTHYADQLINKKVDRVVLEIDKIKPQKFIDLLRYLQKLTDLLYTLSGFARSPVVAVRFLLTNAIIEVHHQKIKCKDGEVGNNDEQSKPEVFVPTLVFTSMLTRGQLKAVGELVGGFSISIAMAAKNQCFGFQRNLKQLTYFIYKNTSKTEFDELKYWCSKADKAYFANDYSEAIFYYDKIFREKYELTLTFEKEVFGVNSALNLHVWARQQIGNIYYDWGQYRRALEYYGMVHRYYYHDKVKSAAILCNYADAHFALGKHGSAIFYSDWALSIDPELPDALRSRMKLIDKSSLLRMESFYKIRLANPTFKKMYYGGYFTSIFYIEKFLKLYPKDPDMWMYKGVIYAKFRQYKKSIEFYDRALAECDHFLESVLSLKAEILFKKGQSLSALRRFDEALECYNTILANCSFYQSEQQRKDTDLKLAQVLYAKSKVLERKSLWDDISLKSNIGSLVYRERFEAFIDACRRNSAYAKEASDRLGSYELKKGGLVCDEIAKIVEDHCALEKYDQALNFIAIAIDLDPHYDFIFYVKGLVHLYCQQYAAALECFETALKLRNRYREKSSDHLLQAKGDALYNLKRYKEALTCYNKAIAVRPDYATFFASKTNTLLQLGNIEEAQEAYYAYNLNPRASKGLISRLSE